MIRSFRSYLAFATGWGAIDFSMESVPYTQLFPPNSLDFAIPIPDSRKLRISKEYFACEPTLFGDLLHLPHFQASDVIDFFSRDPIACAKLAAAMLTWGPDNLVPLIARDPAVSLQNAKAFYKCSDLHLPLCREDRLEFFVRTWRRLDPKQALEELWFVSLHLATLTGNTEKKRALVLPSIPRD